MEEDVAGDQSSDEENRDDGADPEESDDEAVMAVVMASMLRGRSLGFDGMRSHSSSLF